MEKLFLRYVMEVIQRGRTVVRPAVFPTLNVVPAVSDTELSEAQYVPLAQFPHHALLSALSLIDSVRVYIILHPLLPAY